MYRFLFWCTLAALKITLVHSQCHVSLDTGGSYNLSVDTSTAPQWLSSGHFAFSSDGNWLSTADGTLSIKKETLGSSGKDEIGQYQEIKWIVFHPQTNVTMEAALRTYPANDSIVMFIQGFPKGLKGSATQPNLTVSAFPSFLVQPPSDKDEDRLGYLSYGSFMLGDMAKKAGIFDSNATFNTGLDGSGPVVFFDNEGKTAVVLSPLNNFMAASMAQRDHALSTIDWGIMGGVDSLPPGFQLKTLAVCSNNGIGHAVESWGEVMRKVYNKTQNVTEYHQKQDLSLTHLGYWTDNGAYYYYNPLPGKNYQQTLLDIKKHANDEKIPYRYFQLDSWFYPKDNDEAVTTWHATEDVFPKGISDLQRLLDLPLVAHNRYWSVNTTYAKQRGGHFDFFIGNNLSLPTSEVFWQYLLGHAKEEWGLIVYEQDWLNVQLLFTELLNANLNAGRDWLLQMGKAAHNHRLKIQYCMALPRHGLQSLEIPTVTQARVSNDYHLQSDQWKIGVTSHLAYALGLAPSKDTFWTTGDQAGNKYGKTEPYPALQSAVATLSRGPVGPGDKMGGTNKTLLMRCCNEEGLILKPSKPARAIDDQIVTMAFGEASTSGVSGEVWTTYSSHEGLLYGIILAVNLTQDYTITARKAGFLSPLAPQFKAGHVFMAEDPEGSATPFDKDTSFTIKASQCETYGEPFCLIYFSPQLTFRNNSVVLLGDLDKWAPMSEQRVVQIWRALSDMAASVLGQHGETINFSFMLNGKLVSLALTADQLGCATFPLTVNEDQELLNLEEYYVSNVTTTTTTATTATTTLRPYVPTDYDCRFKPPPFTTPAPPTFIPIASTTPDNGSGDRALNVNTRVFVFASLSMLIWCWISKF